MVYTNTSIYPDKEVRRLIRFASDLLEVGDYVERIQVTRCSHGNRGRSWGRRVLIRLGPETGYPMMGLSYPGLKTAPKYDLADWREGLVHLAAHEFEHSRQYRFGLPKTEIGAEHRALWVLNEYRRQVSGLTPPPGSG